jgi:hypothetical protein
VSRSYVSLYSSLSRSPFRVVFMRPATRGPLKNSRDRRCEPGRLAFDAARRDGGTVRTAPGRSRPGLPPKVDPAGSSRNA